MLNHVPIFSQNDPAWASDVLGNSSLTIGSDGCLVSVIASYITYVTGIELTPKALNIWLKEKDGFDGALYYWGGAQRYTKDIQIVSVITHDGTTVVPEGVLEANSIHKLPVVLDVDFKPETAKKDMHFVLYLGDDYIADPIDGRVKKLDVYGGWKKVKRYILHKVNREPFMYGSKGEYMSNTNEEDKRLRSLYFDNFFNKGYREIGLKLGREYKEGEDHIAYAEEIDNRVFDLMHKYNIAEKDRERAALLLADYEYLKKRMTFLEPRYESVLDENKQLKDENSTLQELVKTNKTGTQTTEFKAMATFTIFMTIGLPFVLEAVFRNFSIPIEYTLYLEMTQALLTALGFTAAGSVVKKYIESRTDLKVMTLQSMSTNKEK
jgi:hypothetical protein